MSDYHHLIEYICDTEKIDETEIQFAITELQTALDEAFEIRERLKNDR